jgi:type IV pilus assembly protein PilE
MQQHVQNGFTLIELLIAIAIVAILAGIAIPAYQDSIVKSRRADAKSALLELSVFMEKQYTALGCYNPGPDKDCTPPNNDAAAPALPFDIAPKSAYNPNVASSTVKANYDLVICVTGSATPACTTTTIPTSGFTLVATPRANAPDTKCKALTLDNTGTKTENGTGTLAECW